MGEALHHPGFYSFSSAKSNLTLFAEMLLSLRMDMDKLEKYYSGFWLDCPRGNNAFSYEERSNKRIYVAPVVQAGPAALQTSDKTAFSEIEGGLEYNRKGLENFLIFEHENKVVSIFDNHNHAFFFWMWGLKTGRVQLNSTLVHVDQHTDMRKPEDYFAISNDGDIDLQLAFEYTNYDLNVGNFIQPALKAGIFSDIHIIDSQAAFEKVLPEKYVLDVDLDIFADDMSYIDTDFKIERIRSYIKQTSFITFATSPYFVEQEVAIQMVKRLLAP